MLDIRGLGISAADFGSRVTVLDVGADTLITIDGTDTIVARGVNGTGTNLITQSDFILF